MSSLTASSSMMLRRIISSTSTSGRRFFRRTTSTEIASTRVALLASPIKLHTEFLAATKNTSTTNTDDKELGNDYNNNNNEYSILFLHGLLGNGRNLKTFARNVVKQQQSSGILMDIRGHGKSYQTQKQDNDNDTYDTISTFQDCTQDIDYTLKEFHKNTTKAAAPTSVIVGHSFGGRLALEYAAANAVSKLTSESKSTSTSTSITNPPPLKAVWLLDTVPGEANDSVEHVLNKITDVLHNNTSRVEEKSLNRNEIVDVLTQDPYKMDLGTAQWLAMSYDSKNNDFGFDNDLVTRLKPEFSNQDFMGMLRTILENNNNNNNINNNNNNNNSDDTHVHLVRGGKNTGWSIPIISKFEALTKEFPSTFHLHVLHKSGHNVHVDDMHGLVKLFQGT